MLCGVWVVCHMETCALQSPGLDEGDSFGCAGQSVLSRHGCDGSASCRIGCKAPVGLINSIIDWHWIGFAFDAFLKVSNWSPIGRGQAAFSKGFDSLHNSVKLRVIHF